METVSTMTLEVCGLTLVWQLTTVLRIAYKSASAKSSSLQRFGLEHIAYVEMMLLFLRIELSQTLNVILNGLETPPRSVVD